MLRLPRRRRCHRHHAFGAFTESVNAEHRHDTGCGSAADDGRSLIVDAREEFGRDGVEHDTSSEVLDVAFQLREPGR